MAPSPLTQVRLTKKEYYVSSGRAMKLFMLSTDHYELMVQGLLQSPVTFKQVRPLCQIAKWSLQSDKLPLSLSAHSCFRCCYCFSILRFHTHYSLL